MQKDFHFYVTYALARKVGIDKETAEIIAWSNQHTDDMTEADLYGLQTQSAVLGNWSDRQIQFSVLAPFHFMPGEDPDWPWVTVPNSHRVRAIVQRAQADPFQLGIALHVLQDTFSHQGFSGWDEKANSCFGWWYLHSGLIPNIGHADLGAIPDIISQTWTDPRTNKIIVNTDRALQAAKATLDVLLGFGSCDEELFDQLEGIFANPDYDARKSLLRIFAGDPEIRCSKIEGGKGDFVRAARGHLSAAVESFKDLPRP